MRTVTIEDGGNWQLSDRDRSLIEQLISAVRSLAREAESGDCLTGLGEAWAAMEGILDDEDDSEIEISVQLRVGFREGDSDFEEGIFVGLDLSWEEFTLSVLHTSYSRDVGSDHWTEPYAELRKPGGFDGTEIQRWLEELREIRNDERSSLQVSRDHI